MLEENDSVAEEQLREFFQHLKQTGYKVLQT